LSLVAHPLSILREMDRRHTACDEIDLMRELLRRC
jgi:hypothetical protein